jgi:hypothetical protein
MCLICANSSRVDIRLTPRTRLLFRCAQAKNEVFPEIGTAPQRPNLEVPRDLLVTRTKLP